jgi:hypothetical protein
MAVYETSIGIEIEVNNFNRELRAALDGSLWKTGDEHCGVELRSVPCAGPAAIRDIVRSLSKLHDADPGGTCGFSNAGTHIHIDFIPTPEQKNPRSEKDLERIDTEIPEVWKCNYCDEDHEEQRPNPYPGQRYYYKDNAGGNWRTPMEYIRAWKPKKPEPKQVWGDKIGHRDIVESVKRFMLISKRFAHVLFAIQKPERRFNKYCHTVEHWDEAKLMACKSIQEVSEHNSLAANHRRIMVNPLAFNKYGTVEVRMIAATLDANELWSQIFLFGKLARLAKSNIEIPAATGVVALDFLALMNAAGVHGRVRRSLSALITERKAEFVPTRCASCNHEGDSRNSVDFGFSRPICKKCNQSFWWCDFCGVRIVNGDTDNGVQFNDPRGTKGRISCRNCHVRLKENLKSEASAGGRYIMGTFVGNGVDATGNLAPRRM